MIRCATRLRDDDARTTILRGIGWRAVQGDEWRGPFRRERADAVADAAARRAGQDA